MCVLLSDFFQLSRCLLHLCPKVSPLRAPALGWLERALDRRFRSYFCDRAGFIPNPCAALAIAQPHCSHPLPHAHNRQLLTLPDFPCCCHSPFPTRKLRVCS